MNQRILKLFVGILALLGSSSVLAANHTVTVGGSGGNMSFSPADLTIQRGDTVTFTNAGGLHNVVADNGSFRCATACDSIGGMSASETVAWNRMFGKRSLGTDGYGPPAGGNGNPSSTAWSSTVAFNSTGTFGYQCEVHGSGGMSGRIVVQGTPSFSIGPAVSGNWYDPAQNGHGIQFELVTPTILTAFWFTFDNAGNQVWVVGAGTVVGDHVVMQANRSGGGRFPPNFNPNSIVNLPWGTMTFTFSDCNTGRLDWASSDPAFTASGSMPLKRLTQIQGISCAQP